MKDKTRLDELLETGIIFISPDGFEYIGTASDGIEVGLGNVGREDDLNRFLDDSPSPSDW